MTTAFIEFAKLRISGRAHAKCVTCGGYAFRTDWEPPEGIHPGMHEYLCSRGHKTYVVGKIKPQVR